MDVSRAIRVVLLAWWLGGMGASAQPADTVVTHAVTIASFQDARALAASPAGGLYVADAGRNVVVQLTPDGALVRTLGGPGSREGQFDGPVDVDPTNGLVLLVADAGNGRIQRFTNDFLHLGSLPVGRAFEKGGGNVLDTAHRSAVGRPAGMEIGSPVAVATTSAGDIFVADESQGAVLKWDAAHRPERMIGTYDSGEGALVEPVALAVDGRSNLYVADRSRDAVLVYDMFGSYVRSIADGRAPGVRSVVVEDGRLWIVLPYRVLEYELRGRLLRILDVQLGEPLIDVAFGNGAAYLLTPTRLYRTRL